MSDRVVRLPPKALELDDLQPLLATMNGDDEAYLLLLLSDGNLPTGTSTETYYCCHV